MDGTCSGGVPQGLLLPAHKFHVISNRGGLQFGHVKMERREKGRYQECCETCQFSFYVDDNSVWWVRLTPVVPLIDCVSRATAAIRL